MTMIATTAITQLTAAIVHRSPLVIAPLSESWSTTSSMATTNMFTSASGSSAFQAKPMIWSTLRRGQVALIHSIRNTRANALATNQTGPGIGVEAACPA